MATGLNLDAVREKHTNHINAIHQDEHDYCVDCAIERLHSGSTVHFIHSIIQEIFKDDDGNSYDLTHDDSFQYADGPFKPNGIVCDFCLDEVYPPNDDRKWISDAELLKDAPDKRKQAIENFQLENVVLWCVRYNDDGKITSIRDYKVAPESIQE